jgi:hypothetical protein
MGWYRALAIASMYIFGCWWCYEVIRRFPQDIKEIFQDKQVARIISIIIVWILTVPIALALILYGFILIRNLISFAQTF